MARRGWGGSITTALGVAAGAGAAQLGFGYGLGIINWAPPTDGDAAAAWTASLIWATWIAATSTVLGAVWAQRLSHRGPAEPLPADGVRDAGDTSAVPADPDAPTGPGAASTVTGAASTGPGVGSSGSGTSAAGSGGGSLAAGDVGSPAPGAAAADRTSTTGTTRSAVGSGASGTLGWIALAAAAGIGALVTVLLVAVPARIAVVPDVAAPRDVAAVYAALGVLVGVAIAVWALRSRAAATNVIATVGWLWLLAVVAVVDGVLAGRGLTSAQLGIWQLSKGGPELWIRDWFYWPGAVLSLGSALVIGMLAARRAARYADRRVGATASGAAGPLLVAVAYLLAVPGLAAIDPEQVSAHLIAPYAVIVGLGGSALVATLGQRADRLTGVRVPRQRDGRPADAAAQSASDTAAGSRRVAGAGGTRGRDTADADAAGSGGGSASGGAAGATATGGGSGSATARSTASGGDARQGRRTTARTSSTDGDATGRVPAQRTHETEPTTEPTEESDGSGRRARPPRRTR